MIVVADDPGLYSSQNEQDTRVVARAAIVPVLEPSDSQEAKDFVKAGLSVSVRIMIHRLYSVPPPDWLIPRDRCTSGRACGIPDDNPYERNPAKNVMMPGNAKRRRHLE